MPHPFPGAGVRAYHATTSDRFAKRRRWVTRVPAALVYAWYVARFLVNIPSTVVGLGYGLASGGRYGLAPGLLIVFSGARRFAPKGGQTIGNVFVTSIPMSRIDRDRLDHEIRHATQYAWFLGIPVVFGLAYFMVGVAGSWLIHRRRGPRQDADGRVCDDWQAAYNIFEIDAGLHRGHYFR